MNMESSQSEKETSRQKELDRMTKKSKGDKILYAELCFRNGFKEEFFKVLKKIENVYNVSDNDIKKKKFRNEWEKLHKILGREILFESLKEARNSYYVSNNFVNEKYYNEWKDLHKILMKEVNTIELAKRVYFVSPCEDLVIKNKCYGTWERLLMEQIENAKTLEETIKAFDILASDESQKKVLEKILKFLEELKNLKLVKLKTIEEIQEVCKDLLENILSEKENLDKMLYSGEKEIEFFEKINNLSEDLSKISSN